MVCTRPVLCYFASLPNGLGRPGNANGNGAEGALIETGRGRETHMSQHSSLKNKSKIAAKRNVLKRFERVELLKKRGQWKEGDRGLGLRKTKADA